MLAMDSQTVQDLPEPWSRLNPGQAAFFERQAATEIGPDHELSGRHLSAIAKCGSCDDAAFRLDDGTFAIVHLTWARHQEPASWPSTHCGYTALETAIETRQH